MIHAVNGDSAGNCKPHLAIVQPDTTLGNKGDRGYSDQMEARVFLIGTPHSDRSGR